MLLSLTAIEDIRRYSKICGGKNSFIRSACYILTSLLPKKVKDRLKMIGDNWKYFPAFYSVKDCPATNNAIENYFSTSLKTHRKKQLRTDKGLLNHMKLAALKRAQGFANPKKTLLEI